MTHKGQTLADRIIALPVAFLFNGIAQVRGGLLRRDHSVISENVKITGAARLIGTGAAGPPWPRSRPTEQQLHRLRWLLNLRLGKVVHGETLAAGITSSRLG
jgi:hypothetical protein